MGSVGPAHIVVLINDRFVVFDKNGNQLFVQSLDNFFVITGGLPLTAGFVTFDPRIIFDPSSGRWFAVALEANPAGAVGNNILIAVSNTNDPTAGWTAFRIVGDLQGDRFVDFVTLGLDADGVYMSTTNFSAAGAFVDVTIFSVPKADLVGGLGIVNLTRFENLARANGEQYHGAVDFGATDGRGGLFSAQFTGAGDNVLRRRNILGAGAANATLSAVIVIPVTPFLGPPDGDQPGVAPDLINDGGFSGNVIEVGNSIYAVQGVQDAAGNAAIRFYEINETTNAVVQDILISIPNLDVLYPSVAANANGDVVIGFTGTDTNQFASSMAVVGATAGGVTTFGAPLVLRPGTANYNVTFGGTNRWGDYSNTVIDPIDANRFWTFQEFVPQQDVWGIQVTEINLNMAAGPITLNASNNTMTISGPNPRSFVFNANSATGNITVFGLNNTAVDGVGAALTTGNRGNGVDEFEFNGGQVNGSLDVNSVIIGF